MKNILDRFIAVVRVQEHQRIKEEILELLVDGLKPSGGPLQRALTDWNINDLQEEYQQRLNRYLLSYFGEYCMMTHHERFKIDKQWFVDYQDGNVGTAWHSHACQFSSVYYLVLDNPDERTQFRDVEVPFAEEGDLIIFPSFLVHRSPKAKGRKIVISTNFNVDGASPKPVVL